MLKTDLMHKVKLEVMIILPTFSIAEGLFALESLWIVSSEYAICPSEWPLG